MVLTLQHVSIVSRHGVRPPYPPPHANVTSYAPWTSKLPPSAAAWGMTAEAFTTQELTPHGATILPLFATWMRAKYAALDESFLPAIGTAASCSDVVVLADDSKRDWQTAAAFLGGFGCGDLPQDLPTVMVANVTVLPALRAVVNDNHRSEDIPSGAASDAICARATLEQTSGLLGECALDPLTGEAPVGDTASNCLTEEWQRDLDAIQAILVGADTKLTDAACDAVNGVDPSAVPGTCAFAELRTMFTRTYYEGMFTSPVYYAEVFAEAFMLQFCSDLPLSEIAFGAFEGISEDEVATTISALFRTHTDVTMALASNFWNARSYGSAQLIYIATSIAQVADGVSYLSADLLPPGADAVAGVSTAKTRVSLLFCHDTNLLYLRRLLRIEWLASGWQSNAASTGGTLAFELWRDADTKSSFVKVVWAAASPMQQRSGAVLTLESPPPSSTLIIPECGAVECPLDTFLAIVERVVDIGCVETSLKNAFERVAAAHASGSGSTPSAASEQTQEAAAKVPGLTAAVVMLSLLVAALLGGIILGGTLAGVWWLRGKKRDAFAAQHAPAVSDAGQSDYASMKT